MIIDAVSERSEFFSSVWPLTFYYSTKYTYTQDTLLSVMLKKKKKIKHKKKKNEIKLFKRVILNVSNNINHYVLVKDD